MLAQHFMRDFDEEPALLATLEPLLERASGVVTFNGSTFDLPLLETRFIMARGRWPAALPHLDLLRPARRVWASCFADCRLATLEREVIGLVRDDDIPGGFIPPSISTICARGGRRRSPACSPTTATTSSRWSGCSPGSGEP